MLQSSRQFLRLTILAIGFLLFVIVAVKSATQAGNRQLVVGKPNLLPTVLIATAQPLGDITVTPQATTAVISQPVSTSNAVKVKDESPTSDTNNSEAKHSDAESPNIRRATAAAERQVKLAAAKEKD